MQKIGQQIRTILNTYHAETFLDKKQMQIFLSYFAPQMADERELFFKIYDINLERQLFAMIKADAARRLAIQEACLRRLTGELGIAQDEAEQLLKEICIGLDCAYITQNAVQLAAADQRAPDKQDKPITTVFMFLMFALIIGMMVFDSDAFSLIQQMTLGALSPLPIDVSQEVAEPTATTVVSTAAGDASSDTSDDADMVRAFDEFQAAAEQGNPDMQYKLGICYQYGMGTVADLEKAHYWYQQAAEQGYPPGQVNLGDCYAMGYGVSKNKEQAVYWYEQAAEQGYAEGQFELGFCYQMGSGVTKSFERAAQLYQLSADQGFAQAQTKLAVMCLYGYGVDVDKQKAIDLLEKAVAQDDALAQTMLGFCYLHGQGVAKDEQQAIYWYKKAADQGEELAIETLAELGVFNELD